MSEKAVYHILDESRGIYIPRDFQREFLDGNEHLWNVTKEQSRILFDPDHEDYWEVWDEVLSNAYYVDHDGNEWNLIQEGSVFLVCYDLMDEDDKANFGIID